jgi:DNA-binding transcriptional MerR regulator
MNNENSLMTIEAVSRQLRIPKHTLRFWEKEFEGILNPSRTSGGQRRYTLDHIVRIEEINRLRKNGMGLAAIKRRLVESDQRTRTGSDRIDLLASRVAEVVKAEVCQFFRKENQDSSGPIEEREREFSCRKILPLPE